MNTVVEALIEIPLHSKNKYEIDPTTGKIKLDRVLYASMVYPTEYGSVENTLAPDGDPLDILVVCDNPSFPGCYVPARVLGYLEMTDGGKPDYKLISVGLRSALLKLSGTERTSRFHLERNTELF